MNRIDLKLPTFGLIVATRAALGLGLGLLLAQRMPESRRRAVGITLLTIGAVTTVPAIMTVSRSRNQGLFARAKNLFR